MSQIPNSVPVAGLMAPTDSTDIYAVTDEQYNRGGYRTVQSILERDAISADRRRLGMLVYVIDDNITYKLLDSLDNLGWKITNSKRTLVFVINGTLLPGPQPIELRFPSNGIIVNAIANCKIPGTSNFELAIEKITQQDYENDIAWNNIFSQNLIIDSGRKSSMNSNTNYTINSNIVSSGDIFRLNIISDGHIKDLVVEIDII